MGKAFLSRFTPSLLSHEVLEAIFVQRHRQAERLEELVRESVLTRNKHYVLLVGPRGIGKTHLVSLLYHRIRKAKDLEGRLLIAWLREEEWGVASYLDLVLRILRSLHEETGDEQLDREARKLTDLSAEAAVDEAERLLLAHIGDSTLLILTENLDDTFHGLGEHGQRQLRALLQNHPRFTILATSQSLFRGVSLRSSPFYGFFETLHLQGLTFEDAVEMLARLAEQDDDAPLSAMIRSPKGRARIRALQHLAAGNHRIYMIFSQFLSRDSLDQLVEPLIQTLDDLTPYYQARMGSLSPQQRKIVEFLVEQRGAVAVGEIARQNFLTPQTTSGQLKKLKDWGYVVGYGMGRTSFYELREPLMRLALEVKKLRGEPIRLFVDFLRLWYSGPELSRKLDSLGPEAHSERQYIAQALEVRAVDQEDPSVRACLRDFDQYFWDFPQALRILEELMEIRGSADDWLRRGKIFFNQGKYLEAVQAYEQAVRLSPEKDLTLLLNLGASLGMLGRRDEADGRYREVLQHQPNTADEWSTLALAQHNLGQLEQALESVQRGLEFAPKDSWIWFYKSLFLASLGRRQEALEACNRSLEFGPRNLQAAIYKAHLSSRLGQEQEASKICHDLLAKHPRYTPALELQSELLANSWYLQDALSSLDRLTEIDPEQPFVWHSRATLLYEIGRREDSLDSLSRAATLVDYDAWIWGNHAVALNSLGRTREALASMDRSLSLAPGEDFHRLSNRATFLMTLGHWEEGLAELERAVKELCEAKQDSHAEVAIVRNLLIRSQDPEEWRPLIEAWIQIFRRHQALDFLGQGLVRSIRTLIIPWLTNETVKAWYQIWKISGGKEEPLLLPIRLLRSATVFRVSGDRTSLLNLPREERDLLEPLLYGFPAPQNDTDKAGAKRQSD